MGLIIAFIVAIIVLLFLLKQNRDLRKNKKGELEHELFNSIRLISAGIAHELGSPLQNMNLLIDSVDMEDVHVKCPNYNRLVDTLTQLKSEIKNCVNILDELHEFNKIVREEGNYKFWANAYKVVENTVSVLISSKTIARKIHFIPSIIVDERLKNVNVRISSVSLQQIFYNLFMNSLEEIEKRENGNINASKEYKISVSIWSIENKKVIIVFRDNAGGISSKNMKYVFKPFFTTKGNMNSGLGLSLIYYRIQSAGGSIICRSEGDTTTFLMTLPLA